MQAPATAFYMQTTRPAPHLRTTRPRARSRWAAPWVGAWGWLLGGLAGVASATTLDLTVVDAQGRPLADAVVFLESREARALAKPLGLVEVEQVNRQFNPRVTVVTVGSAVTFPNRDKVRHHVYSFSPTKTFELKLYIGTPSNPVVFDKAGIAALGCNIHDQMSAWVVVVDTPFHGSTGANGRLRLDQLPAGSYRLRSWHPELPPGTPAQDQALVLPAQAGALTLRLAGVGQR